MILPGTRLVLAVFGGLTLLLAFLALFVGAEQTDRVFAWTIQPPATAAFLGAAYAAGCALELLALRRGTWAAVRLPFLTILVFTTVTLAATLLHLDRFHFGSPVPLARFAAWFWLVIYVVVPLAMVVVLVVQERRPAEPSHPVPLPTVLRAAMLAQGAVMIVVGAALFVRPGLASTLWPWTLTPLTARMVAAWLLGFGLAVGLAGLEADLARLDVAAIAYGLLAVLELVVVIRYPETVRWGSPAAWFYVVIAVSILLSSVYGLSRLRGSRVAGRRGLAGQDGLP